MENVLVLNAARYETRVAFVEAGGVAELYMERPDEAGIVGNIYKGRVVRVLPGMQAAFVDIGMDRAAFLYVADVVEEQELENDPDVFADRDPAEMENDPGDLNKDSHHNGEPSNRLPIELLLKGGQEVVVQVSKAPMGTKGARVTTRLTLPGRLVVLMPGNNHIGVSRRIHDEEERTRLRTILEGMGEEDFGLIARTAAEGQSEEELRTDVGFLANLWKQVNERCTEARSPSLVHRDLDLAHRLVRDLHAYLDRIVVDDTTEYETMVDFVATAIPTWKGRVELHQGQEPIFDAFGIEVDLERALARKVWLRSGGYLVIDETEALSAIDVNTGKFVGRRTLEDTIVQTNLEAVKEIVHQLRLRNIGGLIIIDFIDMEREESRDRVLTALEEALKADRARNNVTQISDLGLVEMTRKRVQKSLRRTVMEPCFYCEGTGSLKSSRSVCNEILREVLRVGQRVTTDSVVVHAHTRIADALFTGEERLAMEDLERALGKHIVLIPVKTFHLEDHDVIGADTGVAPMEGFRVNPVAPVKGELRSSDREDDHRQ